jgi:hypothetical protein
LRIGFILQSADRPSRACPTWTSLNADLGQAQDQLSAPQMGRTKKKILMLRSRTELGLAKFGIDDAQVAQARLECGVSKNEDFQSSNR